jgi:hypothetical protein
LQDLYVCGFSIQMYHVWQDMEMEEEDAELGRSTTSIGDVLKGSQNRCGENRGEGGVCLQITDIASVGISTQAAWRVDICGVRWSWPIGIARPWDLPSSFSAGILTGSHGEL